MSGIDPGMALFAGWVLILTFGTGSCIWFGAGWLRRRARRHP